MHTQRRWSQRRKGQCKPFLQGYVTSQWENIGLKSHCSFVFWKSSVSRGRVNFWHWGAFLNQFFQHRQSPSSAWVSVPIKVLHSPLRPPCWKGQRSLPYLPKTMFEGPGVSYRFSVVLVGIWHTQGGEGRIRTFMLTASCKTRPFPLLPQPPPCQQPSNSLEFLCKCTVMVSGSIWPVWDSTSPSFPPFLSNHSSSVLL